METNEEGNKQGDKAFIEISKVMEIQKNKRWQMKINRVR